MPRPPIERLDHTSAGSLVAVVAVAGIAIGLLDVATGREPALAWLYLPLVVASAWRWSLRPALLLAAAAAGMAQIELGGLDPRHWGTLAADAAGWFVSLAASAVLTVAWRRSVEAARRLSQTDPLTGLATRALLLERIEAEMNRCRRTGRPAAVAFLDCDDFKAVNDSRGHGVGDELLQAVAATLRKSLRSYDTVARLGGDEFVLLLPETDGEGVRAVLDRVHRALGDAMNSGGWPVTFSIGAVVFEGAAGSAEDLIDAADRQMYAVKAAGKNGVRCTAVGLEPSAPKERS